MESMSLGLQFNAKKSRIALAMSLQFPIRAPSSATDFGSSRDSASMAIYHEEQQWNQDTAIQNTERHSEAEIKNS
jgi:hypothetical protein